LPRLDSKPQFLLFYRHWGTGGVGVAKTTPAIGRLLACCDGATTAAAIAASLADSKGALGEKDLNACERVLAALEAAGVVFFIPAARAGAGDA
jgi:hypothetical protein